ncbi:MAG: hypothetical protein RIM23_30425 [Coleofasciculus sp. G3-WIS-01]|uniref:hypothetical protein n=1 Tax=Coleofasciculus sp. G3-WIS-01 TaxID=3069528 RepID=UPI003303A8B9
MSLHEREVTLKLKSRPLRLVYLIRNRDELMDAVTLYTHVWGGAANTIFPVPENEEEADTLRFALKSINPDYILVPREGIPSYVSQVLKQSTGLLRPISSPEVQRHIQSSRSDFLLLRDGTVSHIGLICQKLYPSGLNKSNICLVESGSAFDLEVALQCGIPSQPYRDYLVQYLAADVFSCPQTIEQLIKLSLLLPRSQVVILGLVTNSSELSDLFSVVADAAQNAQKRGIRVHLALNGKLHLWGSLDETEAGKVQLDQLLVDKSILPKGESVGELPQTYHFGISRATYNKNVLHRWEQEFSLTKTKEQDNKTHPGFTSEDVEASSSV